MSKFTKFNQTLDAIEDPVTLQEMKTVILSVS